MCACIVGRARVPSAQRARPCIAHAVNAAKNNSAALLQTKPPPSQQQQQLCVCVYPRTSICVPPAACTPPAQPFTCKRHCTRVRALSTAATHALACVSRVRCGLCARVWRMHGLCVVARVRAAVRSSFASIHFRSLTETLTVRPPLHPTRDAVRHHVTARVLMRFTVVCVARVCSVSMAKGRDKSAAQQLSDAEIKQKLARYVSCTRAPAHHCRFQLCR